MMDLMSSDFSAVNSTLPATLFFKFPEPEESAWFEKRCLGVNKVGIMMKDPSKAANFSQVYNASGQQL